MSRRFLPLLCAGVLALAGLALAADEPPAKQSPDEPPLRLKKKKQTDGPAKPEPGKPAKPPGKKEPPKAEDKEPEAEQPEIDEKEVLARITKNMRAVEEKLAKREITDGTRQTQDDILKDLDLLLVQLRRAQGEAADQHQGQEQQDQEQNQKDKQGKAGSKSKSSAGKQQPGAGKSRGRTMSRSQARALRRMQQRASRPGGRQGGPRQAKGGQKQGQDKNMARNQGSGNQPGGGGTSSGPKYRNADLDKTSVWGHLPEALRPDMNAYSNPQPFMPKYDDLIKKYYRTIAEQGRRKGD